jgi:hypothetical protein
MDPQQAIDVVGLILKLVIDVAGLFPGANIPVSALRVVEDGIEIEEAVHQWLSTTPEGQRALQRLQDVAERLGVTIEGRRVCPRFYRWSPLWGWVPA